MSEPIRINGFTSEVLGWKAWLPTIKLDRMTVGGTGR